MVPILSLWLPILLSAVAVFVVSSIIHMVLPYHRSNFKKLPSEDAVMTALREYQVTPGEYAMPYAGSSQAMGSEEYLAKTKEGPVGLLTIVPSGPPAMGKSLVLWFLYSILVGIFAAYIAGQALTPGVEYLKVFQFAGCTAFACYSVALLQDSIWFHRSWSITLKFAFDGLVYALVTAGVFGWLWPS